MTETNQQHVERLADNRERMDRRIRELKQEIANKQNTLKNMEETFINLDAEYYKVVEAIRLGDEVAAKKQ